MPISSVLQSRPHNLAFSRSLTQRSLEADTLTPPATVCQGSDSTAILACINPSPGIWIGSRTVDFGVVPVPLGAHTVFLDNYLSPRTTGELIKDTTNSADTVIMKIDTRPARAWEDHKWVRLSNGFQSTAPARHYIQRAIADRREEPAIDYVLGESNKFISAILSLRGVEVKFKEWWKIQLVGAGAIRLCECANSCTGPLWLWKLLFYTP